jgi:quinol monooxygenase YgiN
MLILTVKMDVRPEKRDELFQTLFALMQQTRKERGCLNCHAYLSIEDENHINLVEAWESQEDLDYYLRSDRFSVLIGTRSLLNKPPEIKIIAAYHTAGMEVIEAARGRQTGTFSYLAESPAPC